MNTTRKPVALLVGATSKWQADGRNTKLAHGKVLDDSDIPVGARWGIGGAIAQKFANEGFFVVLTTRNDYVSNQIMFLSLASRFGIEVVRVDCHRGELIRLSLFQNPARIARMGQWLNDGES